MYMLRKYIDRLRKLGVKLQLIGISHDRSCLLDPVHRVEHDVLIGAPVDANEYPLAPSGALTSNATLLRSALVQKCLAKEITATGAQCLESADRQSCRPGR